MKKTHLDYWKNKYPTIEVYLSRNMSKVREDQTWFKESFDELTYLREVASKLISGRNLEITSPDSNSIYKLWEDYERCDHPTELDNHTQDCRTFISKHYEVLRDLYPPSIVSTLTYWYYVWVDLHKNNSVPVEEGDYKIYFALLQPNHPNYPFRGNGIFVPRVNRYKLLSLWYTQINREYKDHYLKELLSSPEILEECKKGNFQVPRDMYPLENQDLFKAYSRRLLKETRIDVERALHKPNPKLQEIFKKALQAQKEGKEVIFK